MEPVLYCHIEWPHCCLLQSESACGAEAIVIKHKEQLDEADGLILPGGGSTTMRKLIDKYDFMRSLKEFAESGKPITIYQTICFKRKFSLYCPVVCALYIEIQLTKNNKNKININPKSSRGGEVVLFEVISFSRYSKS